MIKKEPTTLRSRTLAAVLLTAMLAAATAYAATDTWVGSSGSTDWATTANWDTAAIATGDSLVFTSANASSSATLTNTLATTFNVAGITFNSGALGYTMTGNAFNLSGTGAANGVSFTNNATGVTETFNNNIVLTNAVTQVWSLASGSTTTFNGTLTSSATTRTVWWGASATASSGTINLNGAANLTFGGSNFSALILRGNGTVLNVGSTGSLTVSSASQSSSGFFNIGNEASAGNVTVNIANGGSITVNGTGNASKPTSSIGGHAGDVADVNIDGTMTYGSGTNLAIGSTSGTTTVDINNGGVLNLNDSARTVAVAASGTITVNSGGTLTSARTWSASTGNLVLAGGTFQATAAQTLDSGLLVSTTAAGSTIDTNGFAVSIGSAISGSGGLVKAGSGTLTLSGANTYTGGTTVSAGTLAYGNNFTMSGTNQLTIAATGTAGTNYATVTSSTANTLTFGGTLVINFSSSILSGGESFNLFQAAGGTLATGFGNVSVAGSYVTGSMSGSSGVWTGTDSTSGLGFTFTESTGILTVSAVPEPATYAALFGGLALVGAVVHRRRRTLNGS